LSRARSTIPKEVRPIIAILSGMEAEMLNRSLGHWYHDRDAMAAYLIDAQRMLDPDEVTEPKWRFPEGVATLPGEKRGPCQPVLVVFMDELANHDVLLLEAVEYLAARCRKVTKYVIFHAASWSAYSWVAHREAFSLSGVTPILKLMGCEPILLDPPC
jgi:hypothetical protein